MIRMCFYIIACGFTALSISHPALAGEGPKPAKSAAEIFSDSKPCDTFSDCGRENRLNEDVSGDTDELQNNFDNGRRNHESLSDTVLNLMKPASGQ